MLKFFAISISTVLVMGSWIVVERRATDVAAAGTGETDPQVSRQPRQIFASGIVEGATEDIELRPEASGRVAEVLIKLGDWVEADQPLLRLDDRSERAQVAASQAKLRLAEANLERLVNGARDSEIEEARAVVAAKNARLQQARLTWHRVQTLRAEEAIAQQEADDQEGLVLALTAEKEAAQARLRQLESPARDDELRAAHARVAAAEASCEFARIALDRMTLRAPTRSQVLDVRIENGELVSATHAEPIVVLADTSRLWVRAFVEEIDALEVRSGTSATVTADGLTDLILPATVRSVSPRMTRKSMTTDRPDELYESKVREIRLEIDNAVPLVGPIVGLRVDIHLEPNASAVTTNVAP